MQDGARTAKEWHRRIADGTDLELTGYSRASAIWLLSGRSLGLLEALLVLAEAGIDTEAMVMGRALHEADHMLLVFSASDEEELVRLWLDDKGKQGYVRPSASRKAQLRVNVDRSPNVGELKEALVGRGVARVHLDD